VVSFKNSPNPFSSLEEVQNGPHPSVSSVIGYPDGKSGGEVELHGVECHSSMVNGS